MAVVVHVNDPAARRPPRAEIERAVRTALAAEGVSAAEMSVTFLEDEPARELNRRWLRHDWVPDVLSFALHEPGEAPVGDIYVGIEQAARQAEEESVPLDEELCRLAIHGVLHVLGHEHEHDAPKSAMHGRQEEILRAALGASGPASPEPLPSRSPSRSTSRPASPPGDAPSRRRRR